MVAAFGIQGLRFLFFDLLYGFMQFVKFMKFVFAIAKILLRRLRFKSSE